MPDLSLGTFTDGNPASAAGVSQNFYTPQVFAEPLPDATSFELINGWLERDNKEPGTKITRECIQPSALTEGGMVGATLDHDYFKSLYPKFGNWENTTEVVGVDTSFEYQGTEGTHEEHESFISIPGGGINFYNPHENAFILLTWNIRWTHDGEAIMYGTLPGGIDPFNIEDNAEEDAAIRLYVKRPDDETYVPGAGPLASYSDCFRRRIGQVNIGAETFRKFPNGDVGNSGRFDYLRHREWSGHCSIGASTAENSAFGPLVGGTLYRPGANTGAGRGWYGASLRIASGAKQARVQVRSMRYICFKLEPQAPG